MKFNNLIALACLTTSFAAFAQLRDDRRMDDRNGVHFDDASSVLVNRFADTFDQLRRVGRRLDPQSLASLSAKLDEFNSILNSRGQQPLGDLRCVSKDNDGRDPWVIGITTDPVTVAKIGGTQASTQAACQGIIASIHMTSYDAGLVCLSKDNDGRDPWVASNISLSARSSKAIANAVSSTQASCNQLINDMKYSPSGTYFCGSKDNDGRAPFIKVLIRADGGVTTGAETYDSYDRCVSAP